MNFSKDFSLGRGNLALDSLTRFLLSEVGLGQVGNTPTLFSESFMILYYSLTSFLSECRSRRKRKVLAQVKDPYGESMPKKIFGVLGSFGNRSLWGLP